MGAPRSRRIPHYGFVYLSDATNPQAVPVYESSRSQNSYAVPVRRSTPKNPLAQPIYISTADNPQAVPIEWVES